MSERLRIIVLGYVVRRPLGGGVFPTLQYVLGLQQLGHEVWFFEDSEDYPACYDPSRWVTDTDPSYGLDYARVLFEGVGLGERWTYYDAHTERWLGPCADRALQICAEADIVIAASGRLRPWTMEVPVRAFVDKDPLFVQVRHLQDPARLAQAEQFTHHFSYGVNIAAGTSGVPDDGLQWRALHQPVVMDLWPHTPPAPQGAAYTTVMQWDAYQPVEHEGQRYGMKSASFAAGFAALPERVAASLEMAVGGADLPKQRLRAAGWRLVDPLQVSGTPAQYQAYLRASRGEFTVAKQGYVAARTGWFSERSMQYLASGRPVVTQDTGFGEWLPVGEGLLSFVDVDGAAAAIEEVESRYAQHCRAARELATAHFAADKVLTRLLAELGWST